MKSKSKWNSSFLSFLLHREGGERVWLIALLVALLFSTALLSGKACNADTAVSAQTDESGELCALLSSLEGVGRCEVSIRYGPENEVLGIVVLCDGAQSVQTRERIILLVSTLFHIGTNRIRVERLSK